MTIGANQSQQPWRTIGTRLRAAREAGHLRQVELALRLGVHRSMISQYERGQVRPSRGRLAQYAILLRLDPTELQLLAGYTPPRGFGR
ncbi:MAG: helix-turn-helix domain-containing protein [Geminicoccaceae bacterium]